MSQHRCARHEHNESGRRYLNRPVHDSTGHGRHHDLHLGDKVLRGLVAFNIHHVCRMVPAHAAETHTLERVSIRGHEGGGGGGKWQEATHVQNTAVGGHKERVTHEHPKNNQQRQVPTSCVRE
jgi:hypothetical protein